MKLGVLVVVSVLVNPHLIVYDATVLALPLLWLGAHVVDGGRTADVRIYWTMVYWLCVALLAPTAAVVGVQASVILLVGILVFFLRRASVACHLLAPSHSV